MFKKSLVYLVLNYVIQFINIALNLLFMRYLSSWQMGSLTLARTWQQFVDYAHLGTRFSLDRYVPVTENPERSKMVASVLVFTLLSACIVFITSLITSKGDFTVISLTFCGIGISLANIIKCYYRACNLMNEMLLLVFRCQLFPIAVPMVIYLITHNWHYFLFTSLFFYTFSVIHLLYREKELFSGFKFSILLQTLKNIALSSVWLFANAIFIFLYLVMDRFFINSNLGREMLGFYSVITFAFTALMIIPSTCAELLFVKVVKESCATGKVFFIREVAIVFGVTIIGVVAANLVMEYFINNFTHYGMLVRQIHLATLAVIPFAFTSIYYHVMNGLDLRKQMVAVNGLLCGLLFLYYLVPHYTSCHFDLDNFLYAKLATGWFISLGYIVCIAFYKLVKSKNTEDVTS